MNVQMDYKLQEMDFWIIFIFWVKIVFVIPDLWT